jgi:16S rRNA (cytosine967-C5)-methyltransferase
LRAAELAKLCRLQARLLDIAATLVRPGGRLVYVTCSLLDAEGPDQVTAFMERHPGWHAEPLVLGAGSARGAGIRLDPFHDGTDGFFIARLLRLC